MAARPGAATGGACTIGVAISIPEPCGGTLRRWRASFGDRLAESVPTHVTLLPPTPLAPPARGRVVDHLAQVAARHRPFTMHLRGTATFRPVSPVVFVQVAEGIGDCEMLESRVRSGPLERDLQFYYHPHVTIAHDVAEPALDRAYDALRDYECHFPVSGFSLYEHGADGMWRPVQHFAFPGHDGPDRDGPDRDEEGAAWERAPRGRQRSDEGGHVDAVAPADGAAPQTVGVQPGGGPQRDGRQRDGARRAGVPR